MLTDIIVRFLLRKHKGICADPLRFLDGVLHFVAAWRGVLRLLGSYLDQRWLDRLALFSLGSVVPCSWSFWSNGVLQ